MINQVELLAPAGSWESLEAGVRAGADAVYIGGSRFGARYYAENLKEEDLLRAIDYVHLHGRKIYLTVNTLLKEAEMEQLYIYLLPYYEQGLDAVIVQDIGALCYIREQFPGLSLHVSTQATVTHTLGAEFFAELGADRIVPARELSLDEIRNMKKRSGLEIECFVHGALCYCYSGQCLLSSMIGGRSGNRGKCAQPCRLPYRMEGRKQGDFLSLKDLNTIELIPELVEAGVDSFKVEGRMKQPEYVYEVISMYRKYTDLCLENGPEKFRVSREDKEALENIYRRRGYSDGYYKTQNGKHMISLKRPDTGPEQPEVCGDSQPGSKIKEKINGKLILSQGKHAKLYMECGGSSGQRCIECKGAVVETALKQPLEKERIKKQMMKTGNTEFEFDSLEILLEGQVFLPMQALNELRREGIHMLEEKILSDFRRNKISQKAGIKEEPGEKNAVYHKDMLFSVSVQSEEQLRALTGNIKAGIIYVDDSIGFDCEICKLVRKLQEENRQVYLAMPYIFRERAVSYYEPRYRELLESYDGVLVRNWEEYRWLLEKGYSKAMISDANLYVFNSYSRDFMERTKFWQYTFPAELNSQELVALGGGILTVYGYQPVMLSANCIRRTAGQCTGKEGISYLTDRRGKKFAVKNYCRYCYNIMYNSMPLVLLDQTEEIKRIKPAGIRLDFTAEDGKAVKRIAALYQKAFLEGEPQSVPETEYTRGHFKRGVK